MGFGDFLSTLGDTVKSLGGTLIAPEGVVWDLATTPFDNKDDNLGTIINKIGHRAGDVFDPLSNDQTFTGMATHGVMDALTWGYKQGVDRPLGTVGTMGGHVWNTGDIGSVFNADDWARAYAVTKERSLGQVAGLTQFNAVGSVLGGSDFKDPLQAGAVQDMKRHLNGTSGSLFDAGAFGTDMATMWFGDPGVLAGKAFSGLRMADLGKLRNFERADFEARLAGTATQTGIRSRDWAGRYKQYEDYAFGDNHLGRPLNGRELLASSRPLQRAGQNGVAIAGLLDDALKLPDPAAARNAFRRVLSVAAGDHTQIDRLNAEIEGAQAIADGLRNLANGTVGRLQLQALKDDVRLAPEFNAEFQRQLDNLNLDGTIDDFVQTWGNKVNSLVNQNNRMLATRSGLKFMPGKELGYGTRALKRLGAEKADGTAAKTLPQRVSDAHDTTLQWARDLASRESYTGVFQKSLYHMPLMVAHPVGLLATPYTKAIPGAINALRQVHFTGVANLHDWAGSTTQLDSMMKIAGVDDAARNAHLSQAYKALTEEDKRVAIDRAEHLSTQALANDLSRRVGRDVPSDFILTIMRKHQMKRGVDAARTDGGRIYASTAAPAEMADRLTNWAKARLEQRAEHAVANKKLSVSPEENVPTSWRVDQVPAEHGTPVALPLDLGQLGNRVPLFDITLAKKLVNDEAWADRFVKLSEAHQREARALSGLEGRWARRSAANFEANAQAVEFRRAAIENLVDAGSLMTRWWKYSVLFRLGYPMRVLMDDHMRISTAINYGNFVFSNMKEGVGNGIHNNAKAWIYKSGRDADARKAFTLAQARRQDLVDHLGRDHTNEEWKSLNTALGDLRRSDIPDDVRAKATKIVSELDPEGHLREYHDTVAEARSLASSITGRKTAITKWKNAISEAETKHSLGIDHGVDVPGLHQKIKDAEAQIAHDEAGRSTILEQIGAETPDQLRRELVGLNESIDAGIAGFADPKRRLGERPVTLRDGTVVQGAYQGTGSAYRAEVGSESHWDAMLTDGEESALSLFSAGAHRSIGPQEPGHLHVWANVLNHQFQNSPGLMAFVKGKVATPAEFAKWLREPEQAYLRERVPHYARDPHDWGSRLQELAHDYVPTPELRQAMREGRVSARQLDKMFPDAASRPAVHGQLANVNAGRNRAVYAFGRKVNGAFRLLAEVPTDNLSRHPFFNSMYKMEIEDLVASRKAYLEARGKTLTVDEIAPLERQARVMALNHVKQTLWDISAHSHAAHVMRFLSPFFAAHQEALSRWWRIASDDPSVVRRFQLAFDSLRNMGLVYDSETGEPVPTGVMPSSKHQIQMRIPFAKDNSAVNKWVRKMGGGKYHTINENALNLVLQNGVLNPGVGPFVSVPLESLVNKYADQPELERVARALNPYPPDSPWQAVQPAWSKRMFALIHKQDSREWAVRYNSNLADGVVQWRLDHGEAIPNEVQFDQLAERAAHDTNRDIALMMMSNLTSFAPAKPGSKFAVQQHQIQRILTEMRNGGHDFEWARKQVAAKVGDIYTALLYSQTNNQGGLSETTAEVSAIKRRRGLLNRTDVSLTRMVIGADAAQDAEADDGAKKYSPAARRWLMHEKVSPYSKDTYLSTKEPGEAALAGLIEAGWQKYDDLTNYLTLQAQQRGLKSYEEASDLRDQKSRGLAYIKEHNFAFAQDWDSFDHGGYDKKIADMRQIASDRSLLNDPTRSDVKWLGQYLMLRDTVTQMLAARKAAGGAGTIQAQGNTDLARGFYAAVQYIRQQSPNFDDFMYHGIIERDPWLVASGKAN